MEEISDVQSLRSGDLEMLYFRGEIRRITVGETCILSSIYGAVRDRNWGTVPCRIRDESIQISNHGFKISTELEYQAGDIHFVAREGIEGKGNQLIFSFQGRAESPFLKNRIGLCILHPVKECKGKAVEVRHMDGTSSSGTFPVVISPHQPFKNLSGMTWSPGTGLKAWLSLEGDIFEMEDQRNWTDASYKSYCTPLHLPFPVEMQSGESIRQEISLRVQVSDLYPVSDASIQHILSAHPEIRYPLPSIGIGRSTSGQKLLQEDARTMNKIAFSHYRVDLWLAGKEWEGAYKEALGEQKWLGWPWQLVLHFGPDFRNELDAFLELYKRDPAALDHMLLFDERRLADPIQLHSLLPILKEQIPGIPLGSGTDAHFAELNRNHPPAAKLLDYVSFSICPQVHAFDELTLIENAEAQADAVESARVLFQKPVVISALTLKQRFNVVATDPSATEGAGYPLSDERQSSVFAAAWTLASIRQLVRAGTQAVTFYETLGKRGIMDRTAAGSRPYPLFYLFEEICSDTYQTCMSTTSSHPLMFEGLLLEAAVHRMLLLVNFTAASLDVELSGIPGFVTEVSELAGSGWKLIPSSKSQGSKIKLKPLSFLRVNLSL